MKKEEKTNAMRFLENKKINFEVLRYDSSIVNGLDVANALNENPNTVFKTLVTVAKSKINYVFIVPVNKELDLKKAAKTVNEKSIDMIKSKELLPLTGYIHGGCSPIGMKKLFKTVIDISAKPLEFFYVSAGKIGMQLKISPNDLLKTVPFTFADIVK